MATHGRISVRTRQSWGLTFNFDLKNVFSSSSPIKAADAIYKAPVLHLSGSFYVVGGKTCHGECAADNLLKDRLTVIGRFDLTTRQWTKAGDLLTPHFAHNAIYDGNYMLVIGGRYTMISEKYSLENGQVTGSSQAPELTNYHPELHLVPIDYCKEMP